MPKKIMIIDDEPDIRIYLMTALEDNGYETCTIEEGEPFHKAVLAKEPDLIVLDIMMPQRSGYPCIRNCGLRRHLEISPLH